MPEEAASDNTVIHEKHPLKKDDNTKYYLDYIDKEMTFTGVIGTVNFGAIAFIADRVLTKAIIVQGLPTSYIFITGTILLSISSLLFLKYRSNLAFYYGQISLSLYAESFTNRPVYYWLEIVDNWRFWTLYFIALTCFYCGFAFLAISFLVALNPKNHLLSYVGTHEGYIIIPLIIFAAVLRFFSIKRKHRVAPNNPLESDRNYPIHKIEDT